MPDSNTSRRYRPEIQGLRTIAALLVGAYHIWFRRVSGGVDVFFVVSGFLITTSLLRQAEREGRIAVLRFWTGLLVRLLPVALIVIACTSLAAFLLLPKVTWYSSIREAVASTVYVENWQLAFDDIDYLAREDAASPFRHYWALAVQGQFYLVWPFLVAGATWLGVRRGVSQRSALLWCLTAVFVASLAYSIHATARNQPFAYFNTFARVWEFALGGLVGVALLDRRLPTRVAVPLGWLGLFGIVTCGLLFQVSRVFPGYAALWPTVCAGLILATGATGSRWGADRLLSGRLLTALGDISYAFYLWHWPLLVFWLAYSGDVEVSLAHGLGIMLTAAVLAWLTTTFVEAPIRRRATAAVPPWRIVLVAGVCCLPLVIGLATWRAHSKQLRAAERQLNAAAGSRDYPGALIRKEGPTTPLPVRPPLPGPFSIKQDLPVSYRDNCHQDQAHDDVRVCEYGARDASRVIAIVGGSHSAQWLPALQVLARSLDFRILNMTKSGCWLSDERRTDSPTNDGGESCARWNQHLLGTLARVHPDAVFSVLTRAERDIESTGVRGDKIEDVPAGYVRMFAEISAMGIDVIAVRDTPWSSHDPAQCIDVFGVDSLRCQIPRNQVLAQVNPADDQTLGLPSTMQRVDLTRFFCDEFRCPPVIGNVLVYRDKHHISATYMKTLAPALEPHLKAWMVAYDLRHPARVDAGS